MPFDDETRRFYAENAAAYAGRDRLPDAMLGEFTAVLPAGGKILELGCGGGQDSLALLRAGFDVTPTDGSAELAAEAERLIGRPVRVMLFEELDAVEAYDGVWACASLLHVPLTDLPDILRRIHVSLRPGGWLVASFKAGQGEGRDRFQRFYNYPSLGQLLGTFRNAADWTGIATVSEYGTGYDNAETDWLWIKAQK